MSDYTTEIVMALREEARLGSRTLQMLLMAFGSLEEIISAEIDRLILLPRITPEKAETIREIENHLDKTRERLEKYRSSGVEAMTIFDDRYPQLLRETSDPPFLLYYKGAFPNNGKSIVAMVGTTKASAEGISAAVVFAKAIAEKGAIVVSGLARGIDTAAHIGSLKAGGTSYAVLGCGFDKIYPRENIKLAEELQERGAIISEFPPHTRVASGRLISRNRIIIGLAHSVVIGEVDKSSNGTLDTATRAKKLGKLLFAIGNGLKPIDPGLMRFGAIPLEDSSQAGLIVDYSF